MKIMNKSIAILLAVLMLISCTLLVGCDAPDEEEVSDMIILSTWQFTSGVPNNLITVNYADSNAVVYCETDEGKFHSTTNAGGVTSVEIAVGDTLSWQPDSLELAQTYVTVIIKNEKTVLGYALIKITQANGLSYNAEVVKSAVYQDTAARPVSDQTVRSTINSLK